MNNPDTFFIIVLATIAITRIWLFKRPVGSPKIGAFKLHHYMYGIIVIALGLAMKNLTLYAIGFGLVVDELPLCLFKRGASWEEYESKKTFTAILVLLVFVYVFRIAITPNF